jgi:polyisoprenoid-binding protein YceI
MLFGAPVAAENYKIDIKGQHAFIQFKIKHLGYSWLLGGFNKFDGSFTYDEKNPSASRVQVVIDTSSVDSNHAERDKHLRDEDFLDVEKYPQAHFVSSSYEETSEGKGVLKGDFNLHGVTRPIEIMVNQIGAGPDPWGGYRRGFEGRTSFKLADYGIKKNLGSASKEVEIYLSIEGVRE